jgi:LysM repeat protein
VSAYVTEGVLDRGRYQSLPYEQQVQQTLDRVIELVSFVQEDHFDFEILQRFWRNETRAIFTVQTIGRLLGRPLDEELRSAKDLLERALPYSIHDYSAVIAPHLFSLIHDIRPATGIPGDHRAIVEQLHYAANVRDAVLQYVLTQINERYQAPRFQDLGEASRWTIAYSGTLQSADMVIQGTRSLLKEEAAAAGDYLRQVGRDIEAIEAAAEERFGVIKRLRWVGTIEDAEVAIHNHLAEWAENMERVTFSVFSESKPPGLMQAVARHSLRQAPRLGLFLMSLAGAGVAAQALNAASTAPADTVLPEEVANLPQPQRGEANPLDTAQFAAIANEAIGARSARFVTETVQQLTSKAIAAPLDTTTLQAEQARTRVNDFFARLPAAQGRQTFVINSEEELRGLLTQLTTYGYREQEVLSLLGLSSVEAFEHPLTLDMRPGRQMPILFPYSADAQLTAPHATIPPADAEQVAAPALTTIAEAVAQDEQSTARLPAMLSPNESYIVYRVQPTEELADIASRYGTTVEEISSDNQLLQPAVAAGQNLLIRRPQPAPQPTVAPRVEPGITNPAVESRGSFAPAATISNPEGAHAHPVVAQYGATLFPTLESMPDDARDYLLGTVEEVAAFFNVRPGDILGILRLEQNNAGWRLHEERVSSAGARGVAQIVARTWNGWASPVHTEHVRNVTTIEEYGGLGFDWSKRSEWRAWQEGSADRSVLQGSNADPAVFENSVAGIARHLVHWGLTTEFAERDPDAFEHKLADAIAVYNSGRPLSESGGWVQSVANRKTTAQYVAEAMATSQSVAASISGATTTARPVEGAAAVYTEHFRQLYDQSFGVALSEEEVEPFIASHTQLLDDLRSGRSDASSAAVQLLDRVEQEYMAAGRVAIASGTERPWPYIHNRDTLYTQKSAVSLLGRTLTLYEIDGLMNRTHGDRDAVRRELMSRPDARLFVQARHLMQQMLNRDDRGMTVANSEVALLVHPLLAGHSPVSINDATLQLLADQLQRSIMSLDEYQQVHGATRFRASPLVPMPNVFRGFGAAINYQAGGRHTGIDIANPRTSTGEEPLIYAVDDATVVHVGPLYCDVATACRGGKAIVLDHGNNVYSLYSHNSEASVRVGDQVTAGQPIGRQGNEGYSFGSHLHFEIHTGAPFSGDWRKPFEGGQFVDPMEYLPLPTEVRS